MNGSLVTRQAELSRGPERGSGTGGRSPSERIDVHLIHFPPAFPCGTGREGGDGTLGVDFSMGSGRSLERFFKKVGRGSQARGIGAFGFGASSLPRGKNSVFAGAGNFEQIIEL